MLAKACGSLTRIAEMATEQVALVIHVQSANGEDCAYERSTMKLYAPHGRFFGNTHGHEPGAA